MGLEVSPGQGGGTADQPAVTVRGQTYTPRSILPATWALTRIRRRRFLRTRSIGNIYYVGTRTLSSFLITTPAGHILINSTYERNVRTIEKSVTQLGFKFSDIRILLGTHAHGDHQEGDALVKELTGAQVMAMAEDVPALEAIKPGGKAHPIDRMLRDGEEVTLGGTTLVAHLTAGHTRGCTTWTMRAQEGGEGFERRVRLQLSRASDGDARDRERVQSHVQVIRSLPCDVPLGDHPAQYNMTAKYARAEARRAEPVHRSANCWVEAEIQEAMLRAQLKLQQKGGRP